MVFKKWCIMSVYHNYCCWEGAWRYDPPRVISKLNYLNSTLTKPNLTELNIRFWAKRSGKIRSVDTNSVIHCWAKDTERLVAQKARSTILYRDDPIFKLIFNCLINGWHQCTSHYIILRSTRNVCMYLKTIHD